MFVNVENVRIFMSYRSGYDDHQTTKHIDNKTKIK
jgi:hypothetical protein